MPEPEPIDYEALRKRFPWVGLVDEEWGDLAAHHREIMARARTDRQRASELVTRLVSAPLGYVDATIVAMAERPGVVEIATIDYKLLGMAGPVSRVPLCWVLQET